MPEYDIEHHEFTDKIISVLKSHFGEDATNILKSSPLLGYINYKTKSANQGSKARGAFGNHYALYVIIEDYINKGYYNKGRARYSKYDGARFSDLLHRQRELPFGNKLQNHALNSRLNEEFKKCYPMVGKEPIVRDLATQRYWIQEDFLIITIKKRGRSSKKINIAKAVIEIIAEYIAAKKSAFKSFLDTCKQISKLGESDPEQVISFVKAQLHPNVDARVFEIISYAILKAKYGKETVWIGYSEDDIEEESLILYKTGRTNANDGGIDFVMKPIGRFFQVTETADVTKYFLDIDKVLRFPITFVVKSAYTEAQIKKDIKEQAIEKYKIESVVDSFMNAVEEIINTNSLLNYFNEIVRSGDLEEVMQEIILQSKVEFNYTVDESL